MPVRKVSNWGGNIIGSFPSLKMRESVKYESTIERDFLYFLEYDSTVIAYYAQPIVITAADNKGRIRTYTPDFQIIRTNRREIVECKPEELLNHPHAQQQIQMGEEWADANGHYFVIATDVELRKGYTLSNLKLLWRYSRLSVPTAVIAGCIGYLKAQSTDVTIENVTRFLASIVSPLDRQEQYKQAPFVYSMLFHHILNTDLAKPITPVAVLWLPPFPSQEAE